MTTEVKEQLYTIPEFLAIKWPDEAEGEYELIEGKIMARTSGSTSGRHGEIVARITAALNLFAGFYAKEKTLGKVYAGASTNLGNPAGSNYPKPDVCLVLSGNGPAEFDGPIPVAPDLVVEVNSPSDTDERRVAKLRAYQEAGGRLIWSVSMLEQYVVVYNKNHPFPQLYNLDNVLVGEPVIPGFKLKVRDLFD